tara:strand:- start:338 stop:547 length:210 start_codon:yes stop_codon:yes gene_type:complete
MNKKEIDEIVKRLDETVKSIIRIQYDNFLTMEANSEKRMMHIANGGESDPVGMRLDRIEAELKEIKEKL